MELTVLERLMVKNILGNIQGWNFGHMKEARVLAENLFSPEEEEALIREYEKRKRREQAQMRYISSGADAKPQQVIRKEKVGRNDPCPCGSGKKYKKCHGAGGSPPPSETGGADAPAAK